MNKLSIIIPAAGQGKRLGLGPKALLELNGHSLLYWVSQKALQLSSEVIVAIPSNALPAHWETHCPGCQIILGGDSHLDTMSRLIQHCTQEWVMNMNSAMPFTSLPLARRVADAVMLQGDAADKAHIAAAFLAIDLPVAQEHEHRALELITQGDLGIFSGPNCYSRQLLCDLIANADAQDWQQQSFLQIAMRHGHAIQTVPGDKSNIKITHTEDWIFAQHLKELLV